jgi:diguanylate cyclase (GGDEF)-like protein
MIESGIPWKTLMTSLLSLHIHKLLLLSLLALIVLILSACLGNTKPIADIDWLDVIGEGSTALALGVWLLMILRSRPAGRVTNLLTMGLGFMFLAMWQDALDEFFRLAAGQYWESMIESILMPLGLGLLTYGVWHWHKEQLSIRMQLQKREQCFREHLWLDGLGQVSLADQVRASLRRDWQRPGQYQALLMTELRGFADFERRHGDREVERMLRETGELLLLNLRQQDMLCRFARDRMVVLLPETTPATAFTIASELQQAVEHFSFRAAGDGARIPLRLDVGIAVRQAADSPDTLMERGHEALARASLGNGLSLVS